MGGFDPIVVDDPIISYWKNTKLSNNHSNILYKNNSFTFETIKRGDVLKKNIKSLGLSKITQNSEVPTKIINENTTVLINCIHSTLNEVLQSGNFPSCLKWADVTPIFRKGLKYQVDIMDLSTFFKIY